MGSNIADAFIERLSVSCQDGLSGGKILIDGLSATLTDVLAQVQRSDGTTQVVRLAPSTPSFGVEAAPSRTQVAWTYLRLGIEHILLGIDHLLFVLGLLLLSKGLGVLLKTITSFTVGHSISLALATVGWFNVPGKPLGAIIALSIVFLAAELVRARRHQPSVTIRKPWIVSFGFGLLHGLGFAGALVQLGLPRSEIPAALLLFNLGVEIGQILFIVIVLVLLGALRRLEIRWPVWAEPVPIYAMGSIAAFWFVGRFVAML
jgi:HupE / UreJ protein